MNRGDWVIIRVDAGAIMGTGHWMRCLTLANALKRHGIGSVFLYSTTMPALLSMTGDAGHRCDSIHPTHAATQMGATYAHSAWLGHPELADADACNDRVQQLTRERGAPPGAVIVDHYALASAWENAMTTHTPVLALDDLADRPHSARWLLDQTVGRTAEDYRDWVGVDTECLLGCDYALIRPEFIEYRGQSLARRDQTRDPLHLLVTLGGVDNDHRCLSVMEAVWPLRDRIQCTVLTGRDHPDWDALVDWRDRHWPALSLRPFVDRMAELLSQADLCIGAAGSTSWERCVLGVPTVLLQLADNQAMVARQLDQAGAAIDLGPWSTCQAETLCATVQTLIEDTGRLQQLSQCASRLCDGQGTERVVTHLMEASLDG